MYICASYIKRARSSFPPKTSFCPLRGDSPVGNVHPKVKDLVLDPVPTPYLEHIHRQVTALVSSVPTLIKGNAIHPTGLDTMKWRVLAPNWYLSPKIYSSSSDSALRKLAFTNLTMLTSLPICSRFTLSSLFLPPVLTSWIETLKKPSLYISSFGTLVLLLL